jgi:hypothetical protein
VLAKPFIVTVTTSGALDENPDDSLSVEISPGWEYAELHLSTPGETDRVSAPVLDPAWVIEVVAAPLTTVGVHEVAQLEILSGTEATAFPDAVVSVTIAVYVPAEPYL